MIKRVIFVSVSGGKDSTLTLALALEKYKDIGVPIVAIFCDTRWEHPLTYKYLDTLEDFFNITIHRIEGFKGGLPSLIKEKRIFPSFRRRFCTEFLKTRTVRKFYKEFFFHFPFKVAEVWVGIRKEESKSRQNTEDYIIPAFQRNWMRTRFPFDMYFHFPIKELSEKQVFQELKKRGIPINPLYEKGFKRVGCFPCFVSEKEIRKLIFMALDGDIWSQQRLKEIEELDKSLPLAKMTANASFEELHLKSRREYNLKKMLQTLPFW